MNHNIAPIIEHKYKFSIVMSVYNVEPFIDEAVHSIIEQDIGFENIQLVFVDDGSTDNSGKICDRYNAEYPNNIIVIHKRNAGLSSSRMEGLKQITGEYVSFFDPDDILSTNTLSSVYSFFDAHKDETDVVAIPIKFFGDMFGDHPLNSKFAQGNQVINLRDSFYPVGVAQVSVATAFFTYRVAKKMNFDTEIVTAEDSKELVKILTEKQSIGVVCEATYHYRRRKTSILGNAKHKKGWYISYLERFSEWSIDYCQNKLGYVPRFVQYTIMYDLQWKLGQQHIEKGLLTLAEQETYQQKIVSLAKHFDDDIIFAQKNIYAEHKFFLLYNKYGKAPEIIRSFKDHRHYLAYQGCIYYALEDVLTRFNFISIKKDYIEIEGWVTVFKHWKCPTIKLILGTQLIETENVDYNETIFSADIPIAARKGFIARIPLNMINGESNISIISEYPQFKISHHSVSFGKYSPIAQSLHNSYYCKNNIMIRPKSTGISIERVNNVTVLNAEVRLLKELLLSHNTIAKKAAFARLLYRVLRPLTPKNIWLITDKAERADDNGEAFFKYLVESKKNMCTPVFAISKHTPDYERIKEIGYVVPYMSWRHKMLHLLAVHTISAYSHNEISSPFLNYSKYYGDLLQSNRVVFLQHGITKDNVSKDLNRFHKNFAIFVTSAERERNAILEDNYGYDENQVVLTGLPRYDRLYNDVQNKITIMPTWLRTLFGEYDAKTSRWLLLPGFENSQYYQFYNELLNSKRLLDNAEQMGYTIQFLPHPVMFPYLSHFNLNSRVILLDSSVCYREVLAESSLVTTDYSSVVFDFAYLKKPVIYTQFESNHYEEGYFDYERDGFGEVEHDLDGTVDRIIEYMENGCVLKDKYRERIDNFFAFNDKNNCQRVYDKIIEQDRND